MSLPNEFDFAVIKLGDAGDPEAFTIICGMQDVTINRTTNTNDRAVRDCAAPGAVPQRRVKAVSKQTDITGSGLTNADEVARLIAAEGIVRNYQVEGYKDDGTDTGELIGTYAGPFMLTANNMNLTRENAGSAEITLASDGAVTYTAAP